MCGIAGYIGSSVLDRKHIEECLHLMARRGPDHAAAFEDSISSDRHVCLLHSRLSIIDLEERANQPFAVGSKVMVYNGELYNYVELRDELSRIGHNFRTVSDTEVLLRVIAADGWKGLERCEGMWAFAIYDRADGSLLLGRDRFGEKPLYLYRDRYGLYFGSEMKFIFALLGSVPPINYQHLYRYMVNGYKSLYKVRETFFEGAEELPPRSVLLVKGSGLEERQQYWNPSFQQEDTLEFGEAVESVRAALIESVRLRLRADVPLAFCMSGGIDSNSLIGIAKRVFGYDVHGFTILNEDERYEEKAYLDCAVRELGIHHTAISTSTGDAKQNLVELVRQHDAPVYTISYYVHWLLMREIAEHGYRISVSGTGADELLTGYYDHHNLYLYEIRGTPLLADALTAWEKHISTIVRNPHLKNPRLYFDNPGFREHIYLNSDGFGQYLGACWGEDFSEETYTSSLLRNRMLNEIFQESVPVILHEDDLNAMYFSIENRSPFLDRGLFELCYRIPSRHLVRDGHAKAVLREAMKGIVPEMILQNYRKVGFNAPIHDLLNVRDSEVRAYLLSPSPIFDHVRWDKIEALIAKPYLLNSESKFLFYFVNSKIFLEEFGS